jgi:hypothetical protein
MGFEKSENNEDDDVESQYPCTKKRLNDKMKVVTVKASTVQKAPSYHLRSRLKSSSIKE